MDKKRDVSILAFREIFMSLNARSISTSYEDDDHLPNHVTIRALEKPVEGTTRYVDALLVKHFGPDVWRWRWEPGEPGSRYQAIYHFTRE